MVVVHGAAKKVAKKVGVIVIEEVQRWSSMKQTGVSLRYMMEFGSTPTDRNLMISAQFLHKELPIRIARRAIELHYLPYGLSNKPAVLKVSDEGGGIARSGLPNFFTYLYSTARNPLDERSDIGTANMTTMAGYGYGLPISRLYARYFGGDLQVISMEGYGTDAYLHLSRLGGSQEPLPKVGL